MVEDRSIEPDATLKMATYLTKLSNKFLSRTSGFMLASLLVAGGFVFMAAGGWFLLAAFVLLLAGGYAVGAWWTAREVLENLLERKYWELCEREEKESFEGFE